VSTLYNRIAGQSQERLAALSDGIFAVAMTLLVLDLRVPAGEEGGPAGDQALLGALAALGPRLVPYVMSFLTLGIFWVGQQTQLNALSRSDRDLTWIHLAFLFGVTLIPFSTGLLAEFITARLALIVYWLNLFLLGAALYASLLYARRAGLMREEMSTEAFAANRRRIIVYQALYAVGAAIGLVDTHWGIGLIFLLQLVSAVAPRIIGPLYRV
jgi:uncharacterized membrane protein